MEKITRKEKALCTCAKHVLGTGFDKHLLRTYTTRFVEQKNPIPLPDIEPHYSSYESQ
jgi:hypothetical protein